MSIHNHTFLYIFLCLVANGLIAQYGVAQATFTPAQFETQSNNASYWNQTASKNKRLISLARQDSEPIETDQTGLMFDNESIDDYEQNSPATRPLALSDWPRKSLSEIRISPYDSSGTKPSDQSSRMLVRYSRDWCAIACCEKFLLWDAPNIRYMPLLFEDVALERYGNVFRNDYLQTALSAVHFFSSTALLPFHARHDPVWSCDYPLGYCRPGNCSQRIFQRQFWGLNR